MLHLLCKVEIKMNAPVRKLAEQEISSKGTEIFEFELGVFDKSNHCISVEKIEIFCDKATIGVDRKKP